MDYETLGKRVKQYRKMRQMTQNDLAEKVDISVSHVSNLENGNTEPSLETLVEICNALRVTADHLLCDSLDAATEPYYEEVLDIFKGCSKREVQELTALLKCIRPHLYKL